MKTLIALLLTCVLAAPAFACEKPKPEPKPKPCPVNINNTNKNTNTNCNKFSPTNRNTFSPTNTNRNTFKPTNTNKNNAIGVGIGRGGDATANATGGSAAVDLSIGDTYGDGYGASVFLGEVWRPNAWVTPWCPQVIPAQAVQPLPAASPGTTPEYKINFWHNGVEYVLEQ